VVDTKLGEYFCSTMFGHLSQKVLVNVLCNFANELSCLMQWFSNFFRCDAFRKVFWTFEAPAVRC